MEPSRILGSCTSAMAIIAVAAAALAACSGDDATAGPIDASATDSPAVGIDAYRESSRDGSTSEVAVDANGIADQSTGVDADASDGGADATGGSLCSTFDGSLDPAAVDAGKALVTQYKCNDCHGSGLTGNNTSISDSGGLVYPPNLTPDPTTGLGCWTDDHIARAILDGIDDQDAALCLMPHFRDPFVEAGIDPDAGALEIVQFLRSRLPTQHVVPDTVCPTTEGGAGGDASGD